jgi:predicted DNA-binding transcriptional regulator YafY
MVNIPAPLDQLGIGRELRAAQLKLSASLPASRRADEQQTRQRIHLDSSWWFQSGEAVPCLGTIHQAVWQDRRLHLNVRWDFFDAEFEQEVEPYGLVAKASVWYLVCGRGGSPHVLRVSQVVDAALLEETFSRPADFDLAAFWERWCAEYETQPPFVARVRVSPQALPTLSLYLDERARHRLAPEGHPDPEGWVTLDLPFESFFAARSRLLGLGRAVEVLEPEALRKSVIDFAEQIGEFYRERTGKA